MRRRLFADCDVMVGGQRSTHVRQVFWGSRIKAALPHNTGFFRYYSDLFSHREVPHHPILKKSSMTTVLLETFYQAEPPRYDHMTAFESTSSTLLTVSTVKM